MFNRHFFIHVTPTRIEVSRWDCSQVLVERSYRHVSDASRARIERVTACTQVRHSDYARHSNYSYSHR